MNLSQIIKEQVHPSWLLLLEDEFKKDYFQKLESFLKKEIKDGKKIYPAKENIFNALKLTGLKNVNVVIIGQDPYHGEGQAHGLSFSVPNGIKVPPSLVNIYKELNREFEIPIAKHGYLEGWAKQGVLLLNAVLTVEATKAASHQKKGWEQFTDQIISIINQNCHNVVFLLWGSYAQKKGELIDKNKHLILEAPHPSPLSAHRGFIGCGHFQKANDYLKSHGKSTIDWRIDS